MLKFSNSFEERIIGSNFYIPNGKLISVIDDLQNSNVTSPKKQKINKVLIFLVTFVQKRYLISVIEF